MKSLNTASLLTKFVAISGVVGMVGISYEANAVNNIAENTIVISNAAYNNGWAYSVSSPGNIDFTFTGIPDSVTSVSGIGIDNFSNAIPGNGSATVTMTLLSANGILSSSSATDTFVFSNSGNIGVATIYATAYSVNGTSNINSSITYFDNLPFMTWSLDGLSFYLPNVQSGQAYNGWLKITGPNTMTISSLSILNSTTCQINSITHSETNGNAITIFINLGQLESVCPSGINWNIGVPIPISLFVTGANVTAQNVGAYAYQNNNGYFKRIPVLLGGGLEQGN